MILVICNMLYLLKLIYFSTDLVTMITVITMTKDIWVLLGLGGLPIGKSKLPFLSFVSLRDKLVICELIWLPAGSTAVLCSSDALVEPSVGEDTQKIGGEGFRWSLLLFLNLLQFINLGKVDYRRRPFTVKDR